MATLLKPVKLAGHCIAFVLGLVALLLLFVAFLLTPQHPDQQFSEWFDNYFN